MHSAAIFFGVLIFGWGASSLRLALCDEEDPSWEPSWERWMLRVLAASMFPLPLALTAGGSALVR